jgi:hypothetical protein
MNEESKLIFKLIGFKVEELKDLDGVTIPREVLLSDNKYEEVKKLIPDLKQNYSSSLMTSLHKNADKTQRWPLLNLVRQILNTYRYKMEPIRKSDGYTLEGVKKYKRYFEIKKQHFITNDNNDNHDNDQDISKKIEKNNNQFYNLIT